MEEEDVCNGIARGWVNGVIARDQAAAAVAAAEATTASTFYTTNSSVSDSDDCIAAVNIGCIKEPSTV